MADKSQDDDKPQFMVRWIDRGQGKPQCPPRPEFPDGEDVDCSDGAALTCKVFLPKTPELLGWYLVVCNKCETNALITTAGRPDDPRSVKLACDLRRMK